MSLSYIIKEGVSGFKRARLASLTSIFSLFLAVLLLGVLARVSYNAYEVAESLRKSIDIEVFLMDLDSRTTQEIRQKLKEEPLVEELTFISKDSAAAIFKEEFGSGGSSLADLQFLPASFRLKVDRQASISEIEQFLIRIREYRGIDEIKFNEQLLTVLENRFQTVALAGSGIGLLILLTALILVFNTIRLTIYAKKGLIKAMKLVGATNGFIRRPFVVEGIIQGTVSGVMAIGALYLLFNIVLPGYVADIGLLQWPFGRWYYLSGAMLVLSIFMGFWGSLWAARKFIRETGISSES